MGAVDARAAEMGRAGDERPVGVRRVAALTRFVLGADAPAVECVVTVDLATLIGLAERPGELSGYGPLSPDTTRTLATDATWRGWCRIRSPATPSTSTSAATAERRAAPAGGGTRLHLPVPRLRPAAGADLDHREEWDLGGRTDVANLRTLCRMHHNLKTRKLWKVDINPDGSETWTSALGFVRTKPPPRLPDLPEPLPPPPDPPMPTPMPMPMVEPAAQVEDPPPPGEPPPLDDFEYAELCDVLDRGWGRFAERAYHALRSAGLVA